jgi:hypothetical protein
VPEPELPPPPGGWLNPWLIGSVHEQAVSVAERQSRGAWYTPRSVVEGLVRFAAQAMPLPAFAVDPTCGGGAFLLAVLDYRIEHGMEPAAALASVAGTDIDADAVTVCRWSLRSWAQLHDLTINDKAIDVTVADALVDDPPARWPENRLVIGNPPFASPLRRGAVPVTAADYRDRHRDQLGQYADLAAMHFHRAVDTAPGSSVLMVQPQSVLSSRDVEPLRTWLGRTAGTLGMWAAREPVFEAGVRTCAPLVAVGRAQPEKVELASGPSVSFVGYSPPAPWSSYAARALGAPTLTTSVVQPVSTLGRLCSATAGFRDEYYGLVEACGEAETGVEPPNRLVTVGSVEPLSTTWGRAPIRFGNRKWRRPFIDEALLDDKIRRWYRRQAVPKVVVATQSKLLEPVIDDTGTLVPSTPLLSVHATPDDLAYVAAVLLAPPVVALAWERWFGSAMAVDALKLAAGQLSELPLPVDRGRWQAAAELIAAEPGACLRRSVDDGWQLAAEVARLMNDAFGADQAVLEWWLDRAPAAGKLGR